MVNSYAAIDLETVLETIVVSVGACFDVLFIIIKFIANVLSLSFEKYAELYRAYPTPTVVGTYVFICVGQDSFREAANVAGRILALPKSGGERVKLFSSDLVASAKRGAIEVRDNYLGDGAFWTLPVYLVIAFVALAGAVANFYLIQPPMAVVMASDANALELLGMDSAVLGAFIIVALEFVVGFLLMEAAGISKLNVFRFSENQSWSTAQKGLVVLFALLVVVFSILEIGLALFRHQIVMDALAVNRDLRCLERPAACTSEPGALEAKFKSFPLYIQMTLGGLLPWVLAFATVALERFLLFVPIFFFNFIAALFFLIWVPLIVVGTVFERLTVMTIALFDIAVLPPTKAAELVRTVWVSYHRER